MLDEQEMPPEMSSADLEKELEQIRIDFFGMM
jgi:hypothetical protein